MSEYTIRYVIIDTIYLKPFKASDEEVQQILSGELQMPEGYKLLDLQEHIMYDQELVSTSFSPFAS